MQAVKTSKLCLPGTQRLSWCFCVCKRRSIPRSFDQWGVQKKFCFVLVWHFCIVNRNRHPSTDYILATLLSSLSKLTCAPSPKLSKTTATITRVVNPAAPTHCNGAPRAGNGAHGKTAASLEKITAPPLKRGIALIAPWTSPPGWLATRPPVRNDFWGMFPPRNRDF